KVGEAVDLDELSAWLIERGYKRIEAVEYPGEFTRRGGIIDVFPPDAEAPYRLELFGDELESIRQFSAQTQRSLRDLNDVTVLALHDPAKSPSSNGSVSSEQAAGEFDRGHLVDYLPPHSWVMIIESAEVREQGRLYLE